MYFHGINYLTVKETLKISQLNSVLHAHSSPLTPKEVSGIDVQMSVTVDIWSDYSHFMNAEFLIITIQMKCGTIRQAKICHLLSDD